MKRRGVREGGFDAMARWGSVADAVLQRKRMPPRGWRDRDDPRGAVRAANYKINGCECTASNIRPTKTGSREKAAQSSV